MSSHLMSCHLMSCHLSASRDVADSCGCFGHRHVAGSCPPKPNALQSYAPWPNAPQPMLQGECCSCRLQAAGCRLQGECFRLNAAGCRLQGECCRVQAAVLADCGLAVL